MKNVMDGDIRVSVSAHNLQQANSASFMIDRPYGLGCFLLMRFSSPVEVRTNQGLVNAEPGECILYSAEFPQWYRSRAGSWVHDWMHIEDDGDTIARIAARNGVPLNMLLKPCDTHFFPRFFKEIGEEQQQAEAGWEEAVEMLVRQLLLKIGRALHDQTVQFTAAETAHIVALRALRWRVHEQLARRWTVGEMASQVGLSSSRFAALYQRFFGVSPVEDLLRVRIKHAQYLLNNRAMSVGAAASQCGFNSVDYFTHVFHQRVGCAPRDYYRRGNV